jgi:hypothetical protein
VIIIDQEKAAKVAQHKYDSAMMERFDSVAKSMGYQGWETCCLRAHRPGPFEKEGTAFYDWMEACNVKGYEILEAVSSGRRAQPTVAEFLGELPEFKRP